MSDVVVGPSWRERIEELSATRKEAVLVAVLVVVLIVGAVVMWRRSGEPEIAPPAVAPVADTSVPVPGVSTGPTPASSNVLLVHVAGAVRRPGLYELPAGARIADALDAARGPRGKADLEALNLAEPLIDGQKIDVPKIGETAPPTPAIAGGQPTASPMGTISINTADQAMLEAIPGIGPVTATAIISHRDEIGQFTAIDQLLDVSGIGPATLESMRPYISL